MIRAAEVAVRDHNPLTFAEQRALVALSLVPGVGSARIAMLVKAFGSAEEALHASPNEIAGLFGIGRQTALSIARFDDFDAVDRQIDRAYQIGAEMLSRWDDRYPHLLKEIDDPPAFLWTRGVMPRDDRDSRSVAVVGTRRASEYGKRAAREFAGILAGIGCTIVSGLAYGIDAAAHRAALEADGRTIAVLGSGVDRIYPGRHTRIADAIAERGAVVSEYPMGEKPDGPNFPRRNRVISGIARGTLIVEAYEEGGALITARLAVEQNREVFAVPGPIYSKSSKGANALIRNGAATLVQRVEDMLDEFGLRDAAGRAAFERVDPGSLSDEERLLCDVLDSEPVHIDRICAVSGLDPATALVYLLSLEFKGVVRQLAGKQFFLARTLSEHSEHPSAKGGGVQISEGA